MGNRLFTEVTDLTGLPEQLISEELVSILDTVGSDPSSVTLDDLRAAMMMYLTEVIGSHSDLSSAEGSPSTSVSKEK